MTYRRLFQFGALALSTSAGAAAWWIFATNPASGAGQLAQLAFPPFSINESQFVEFETSSKSYQALSPRERTEQKRDWLLYTVLTNSTASALQVEQAVQQLPAVRLDALMSAGFPLTGESRGRTIGGSGGPGEVVALVPKFDGVAEGERKARQADLIAEIADEERKTTGEAPARFHIFEYSLLNGDEGAMLRYLGPEDAAKRFSIDSHYTESGLSSIADLETFLRATDDLVMAEWRDGRLFLGGRKLQSTKHRGIGVPEIASIWQSMSKNPNNLGFSLDPKIDFEQLEEKVSSIELRAGTSNALLGSSPGFSVPDLSGWSTKLLAKRTTDEDKFADLEKRFLQAASKLGASESQGKGAFHELWSTSRFQTARYDGELKGTEVGMVLFYTDLLMKLWGQDRLGSAPRTILEFPNKLELNPSSLYEKEMKRLAETRLWLGTKESALCKTSAPDRLYMSRVATRVFAVPHSFLDNKDLEEAEPNVFNRTFIEWWNRHYAEVAQYEPQYQRLNQIMKWSQVVSWLHSSEHHNALAFLRSVEFPHEYWFPDWVKANQSLVFRRVNDLGFKPRGYKQISVEAMDISYSRQFSAFGNSHWTFSGGVSLADRATMQKLPFIEKELPAGLRRGSFLPKNGIKFETVSRETGVVATRTELGTARLRGAWGEVKAAPIERSLLRTGDSSRIAFGQGDRVIGSLEVSRTGRGFRAGWQARDGDSTLALAKKISAEPAPMPTLLGDPDVGIVVQDGNRYFVQMRGSNNWVRMERQAGLSEQVSEGAISRVSAGPTAPIVETVPLKGATANDILKSGGFVEMLPPPRGFKGVGLVKVQRPPPGASPEKVAIGGRQVTVYKSDGRQYLNWNELPAELRNKPGDLTQLAGTDGGGNRWTGWTAREGSDLPKGLLDDPAAFRAQTRTATQQELREIAELQQMHKLQEANGRLAYLEAMIGQHPDIKLQRALLDIDQGHVSATAYNLTAGGNASEQGTHAALNAVNSKLSSGSLTAPQRAEYITTKEFLE